MTASTTTGAAASNDSSSRGDEAFAMRPLQNGGGEARGASRRPPPPQSSSIRRGSVLDTMTSVLSSVRQPIVRQSVAFFMFGLLNNSLYVVILTAALELIPKGTPTGLVAFFNIFPALIAKAVWPYVLKGTVRYTQRVWSCVAMNLIGLVVIALLPSLWTRLAGIGLASFSSGLGELTFLQLSTRFSRAGAGRGVAWFSSGTGAAGLVGALAWWIVRPLGVAGGLLSLSFLPLLMALSYSVILPSTNAVDAAEQDAKGRYEPLQAEAYDVPNGLDDDDDEVDDQATPRQSREERPSQASTLRKSTDQDSALPLAASSNTTDGGLDAQDKRVRLTLSDKMALIKPMLMVYILPLVLVYLFEYTINQGVAPTLLYPLPTSGNHPLLALIIKELKDYYPFYQLTYQTFVFLSRSSISIFRLPAIPKRYLWLPAIVQGTLLAVLITESLYNWFRASIASPLAIVLICVEGLAGGSAYVSVFYQIGTNGDATTPTLALPTDDEQGRSGHGSTNGQANGAQHDDADWLEQRRAQEHEFRIGCVGVGDAMGILVASLVAMPLELALCDAQVRKGRTLCKEV